MGRPSSYREEYAEQAYKLCLLGATDQQLADFFGVVVATIYNWKRDHPAFFEALKAGKDEADAKVVESLYRRALGYSHPEDKVLSKDGVHTDTVRIEKHYPPDPTACIFWLKNRQKDNWRDKQEIDVNDKRSVDELSDTALLERVAKAASEAGIDLSTLGIGAQVTH